MPIHSVTTLLIVRPTSASILSVHVALMVFYDSQNDKKLCTVCTAWTLWHTDITGYTDILSPMASDQILNSIVE